MHTTQRGILGLFYTENPSKASSVQHKVLHRIAIRVVFFLLQSNSTQSCNTLCWRKRNYWTANGQHGTMYQPISACSANARTLEKLPLRSSVKAFFRTQGLTKNDLASCCSHWQWYWVSNSSVVLCSVASSNVNSFIHNFRSGVHPSLCAQTCTTEHGAVKWAPCEISLVLISSQSCNPYDILFFACTRVPDLSF